MSRDIVVWGTCTRRTGEEMASDRSVRTMRRTVRIPVGQLLEGVAGLNGAYNEYFFPKPSASHALVDMQYGVSLYVCNSRRLICAYSHKPRLDRSPCT